MPKSGEGGTGDLYFYPLLGLLISSVYLRVMQSQSKKTLFQRYQNSVTHSNANGNNNNFIYFVIFFFGVAVTVASLMKSLGFRNYIFKGTFPIQYFTVMTVHTVLGSTCFLWNSEFKDFLVRKVVSCTRLNIDIFRFVAQKKIHPAYRTSKKTYRRGKSEQESNKSERRIVAVDVPLSILVVQEANQQI